MYSDPLADMLTRIRNAQRLKTPAVVLPYSKLKASVAEVLKAEGYLASVAQSGTAPKTVLELGLAYEKETGRSKIESIKSISKPGRRVYVGYRDIPRVLNGYGIVVISTPQGVVSGKVARQQKLGGELLCEIY